MDGVDDIKAAYSSAKHSFAQYCSDFREKTKSYDDCQSLEQGSDQLDVLYGQLMKSYEACCAAFHEEPGHIVESEMEALKVDYQSAAKEYKRHVERLQANKVSDDVDTVSNASFSQQLYQLSAQIESLSGNSQQMQKELGENIHELRKTTEDTNMKLDHMITKEELTDKLTKLSVKMDGEIGDVKNELEMVKDNVTHIQEKMVKDVTGLVDALRSELWFRLVKLKSKSKENKYVYFTYLTSPYF